MELESGKTYLNRRGEEITVEYDTKDGCYVYFTFIDRNTSTRYRSNGQSEADFIESPLDLVSLVTIPLLQKTIDRHNRDLYAKDDSKPVMTSSPTGALRDNKNKLPLSWVPLCVVEAVAAVLWRNSVSGGGKYPDHNWQKGANYSTPLDSLLRHAGKRAQGEVTDPDDGLPHSWKILCNAAFLVFYEKHYPQLDDLGTKASYSVTNKRWETK